MCWFGIDDLVKMCWGYFVVIVCLWMFVLFMVVFFFLMFCVCNVMRLLIGFFSLLVVCV